MAFDVLPNSKIRIQIIYVAYINRNYNINIRNWWNRMYLMIHIKQHIVIRFYNLFDFNHSIHFNNLLYPVRG